MNRLLALYLLASGLALAGPHRPDLWPVIAALHLVAAGWLLAHEPKAPAAGAWRWIAAAYPLILMPLLYAELPLLNQAVYGGHYFDELIINWERALFGTEPARTLAPALPSALLSESLLAAYVSYYPIIYVPPLVIAVRRGPVALRAAAFTLTLVFLIHYLFFVWFPVEGPRYRFESPVPEAARGPVYQVAHVLLEAGSSRGAAFPSSHVGVSVAAAIVCWRWWRPTAPVVALLAVALAMGAVYGGFHYGIDAIAGAALGAGLALVAPAVLARFEKS